MYGESISTRPLPIDARDGSTNVKGGVRKKSTSTDTTLQANLEEMLDPRGDPAQKDEQIGEQVDGSSLEARAWNW
jgi:hypothetical protein